MTIDTRATLYHAAAANHARAARALRAAQDDLDLAERANAPRWIVALARDRAAIQLRALDVAVEMLSRVVCDD